MTSCFRFLAENRVRIIGFAAGPVRSVAELGIPERRGTEMTAKEWFEKNEDAHAVTAEAHRKSYALDEEGKIRFGNEDNQIRLLLTVRDGKRLLRIEESILYEEGAILLRDKLIELFPLQEETRSAMN